MTLKIKENNLKDQGNESKRLRKYLIKIVRIQERNSEVTKSNLAKATYTRD